MISNMVNFQVLILFSISPVTKFAFEIGFLYHKFLLFLLLLLLLSLQMTLKSIVARIRNCLSFRLTSHCKRRECYHLKQRSRLYFVEKNQERWSNKSPIKMLKNSGWLSEKNLLKIHSKNSQIFLRQQIGSSSRFSLQTLSELSALDHSTPSFTPGMIHENICSLEIRVFSAFLYDLIKIVFIFDLQVFLFSALPAGTHQLHN